MTGLTVINPPQLPKASGFSYAVRTEGGTQLYLAGHAALNAQGEIVGSGDLLAQFEQVLKIFRLTLSAAGGEMNQIVKMTIYVTDVERYRRKSAEIGDIYRRFFADHYPAMTLVQVERLWDKEALIEIDGIAVL
jgi:enamine deaminase RidA (YjgF/YER057c/UK114 family)